MPRIQMTRTTRVILALLFVYVFFLLSLILFRFIQVFHQQG